MVKKAKKAKGGKKKAKIILPPFDYVPPALHEKPSHFVRCRICSTALPHLNFEWPAVPTEITLDVIKNAIVKRHGGSLTSITLYKDMVHPDTCIHADDSATLSSLGVAGILPSTADAELPTVTFHYDFRAACPDDAIVNVEYGAVQSAFGIPLKAYLRVQAHTAAQR